MWCRNYTAVGFGTFVLKHFLLYTIFRDVRARLG